MKFRQLLSTPGSKVLWPAIVHLTLNVLVVPLLPFIMLYVPLSGHVGTAWRSGSLVC